MNNTEPFDEWIRGEMENLDSPPEHFRQADIWQKLQTELHPVPEKKPFFVIRRFVTSTVRRAKVSTHRIAAAAALLLLAGGICWKIQTTPIPTAGHQAENKPQSSPALQQKQPLRVAKNDVLTEKVTFKKQVQTDGKRPEISLAQAPMVVHTESDNNVGKVWNAGRPVLADVSRNPADVSEAPKNTAENAELPEVVPVPANPTNPSTLKITPKPKFKIVHANELADYQKAELAEIREKEAKAKGFIVINWKANTTTQSESSLMSYFKNNSSKAD